jgi:hypothetical protein
MRLSVAAVTFLLLTGAAHAKDTLYSKYTLPDKPGNREKDRKIDDAYQAKIKSQPVQAPASNDPWGSVRASDTTQGKGKGGPKTR